MSGLNDWTEANQRLLVAEFGRIRALVSNGDTASASAEIDTLCAAMPAPAAIDTVARLFQLTAFERDVLLLAAGVEMDSLLAALCGQTSGPAQRPWATFGLALATLTDPHWSALAPREPLRRLRLVEVDEGAGLTATRLKIDERVLHFIGGLNYLDHRLAPLLEEVPGPGTMSITHRDIAARAADRLRATHERLPSLVLSGDDISGQQDVAATIAAHLGVGLFRLRARDVPATASEQAALAVLWTREAALLGCGIFIAIEDGDVDTTLARFIARLAGLVIIAGRHAPAIDTDNIHYIVDRPDAPERRRLWNEAVGVRAQALAPALNTLASQYRLSARRIAAIAASASDTDPDRYIATLHHASRVEGPAMPSLAQRIDARASWDDLVLPEPQRAALQQLAVHTRHRLRVHHEWGFADKSARGLGIATLFWGESGTGKTLAAEVLANVLDLVLYRIDLSAVVSKYIGETEKNLRKLFDAAEDSGAVLLFDEADALFGKRSEVKDSHDRYANIEVSYLLQRMEAYSGLAILTTNHKAALDSAFQRRIRFVVHFPFPDQAQREIIWRAVFPAGAPLNGIDYAKLARLDVPGGTIRNIAMSAAFLAAETDVPIGMQQLLRGAQMEATKRERPYSDAETRGWV
ncbi:MAG: family ATPase [Gammaproteobacteria bacterium]|nr:family ATPase [Gammaproteobacteria bacterium]